mmetsp:Transcript_13586/g.21476  ORF Transcript_13586/g.21476 Transcript_13586/m.21476 type:complete len:306 (+) Transcript_13586:517-1434(+)
MKVPGVTGSTGTETLGGVMGEVGWATISGLGFSSGLGPELLEVLGSVAVPAGRLASREVRRTGTKGLDVSLLSSKVTLPALLSISSSNRLPALDLVFVLYDVTVCSVKAFDLGCLSSRFFRVSENSLKWSIYFICVRASFWSFASSAKSGLRSFSFFAYAETKCVRICSVICRESSTLNLASQNTATRIWSLAAVTIATDWFRVVSVARTLCLDVLDDKWLMLFAYLIMRSLSRLGFRRGIGGSNTTRRLSLMDDLFGFFPLPGRGVLVSFLVSNSDSTDFSNWKNKNTRELMSAGRASTSQSHV